jgi:uncharacterized damage-inducible protein DinB
VAQRDLEIAADFLGEFQHKIEACVSLLSEEQVWWKANAATNSIGNLLLHLQGNLSQWILASLGGVAYERHRTAEFKAVRSAGKQELLGGLRSVVEKCQGVIRGLPPSALADQRLIQGSQVDGAYVIWHVVEHMSYHTGQIVHMTKELRGPEAAIEFYPQHRGQ